MAIPNKLIKYRQYYGDRQQGILLKKYLGWWSDYMLLHFLERIFQNKKLKHTNAVKRKGMFIRRALQILNKITGQHYITIHILNFSL